VETVITKGVEQIDGVITLAVRVERGRWVVERETNVPVFLSPLAPCYCAELLDAMVAAAKAELRLKEEEERTRVFREALERFRGRVEREFEQRLKCLEQWARRMTEKLLEREVAELIRCGLMMPTARPRLETATAVMNSEKADRVFPYGIPPPIACKKVEAEKIQRYWDAVATIRQALCIPVQIPVPSVMVGAPCLYFGEDEK